MPEAIRSPLLIVAPPEAPVTVLRPFSGIAEALADQQRLTAVDEFARRHKDLELPPGDRFYRDLIPAKGPQKGQQYAFEVNLDVCTGCKACVTGCHSLNGLDDAEVWRTVGMLHGGTAQAPAQQTVTTSCHHCLEPACLAGCPVKAYEKDPVTGIVRHLDDQCIGCQYCVFMCPYDAPKFNKARGIVRKCDMCSDRLAHGEAPACVQACPNEAIRITVVDRTETIQASEAQAFLPGAPAPSDTLPTTVYKTDRVLPRNMLPADFYRTSPEHAHPPLVVMLGLTQLSVGAFILNLLAQRMMGSAPGRTLGAVTAVFALALGMAALGASTLHLGRPRFAFRAFLGLGTSWLSREILGFSVFAGLATAFAASFWVPALSEPVRRIIGFAAAGAGALAVFSSVMVYAATRRPHWRGSVTGFKFGLTSVVLGAATVVTVSMGTQQVLAARGLVGSAAPFVTSGAHRVLCVVLLLSATVKLASELSAFRHLSDPQHSILKRTALLMARDLRVTTRARFACGAIGGIALPAAALLLTNSEPVRAFFSLAEGVVPHLALTVFAALSFVLCLIGELLERFLFFAAAPASKMPGGIG